MSKLIYEALQVKGLREVITTISTICQPLGLDFFCVGALARNIWYVDHKAPARGTRDVDFGIGIPSVAVYQELRQRLIEQHNYKPLRENPLRLYTPTGTIVDLLPFGSMGLENAVLLDGMGLADLQLDGFK